MEPQDITIKELAKKLGMSSTTISRVLNGHARQYRISEKTEALVKETLRRYNFQPNEIAQNLRLRRTNTVGLVIPDISNPFFAQMARTIDSELRVEGKLILLCDSQDQTDTEKELLKLLSGRKVDGLIVAPVGLSSDHFTSLGSLPIVMIDRYFEELDIPFVSTNNREGAHTATKYLLDRGHRQIACIQGLPDTKSNQERVNGFKNAMEIHDVQFDDWNVKGFDFSTLCGYEVTQQLLKLPEIPTAILALSNLIAIGAMKAIKEHGLSIPEDLSLISYDEQPYFELTSPPITTVKQPIADIGQKAVQKMTALLNGQTASSELLMPEIIERQSVKSIIQ